MKFQIESVNDGEIKIKSNQLWNDLKVKAKKQKKEPKIKQVVKDVLAN